MKRNITNEKNGKAKVTGFLLCAALFTFHFSLFTSCSDFLEIPSRSEIVLEEFWNEKADVDNVVSGCYARMQGDDMIRRMIVWGECRADNVMAGTNIDKDGNLENVLKENITTKNPYTNWDGFYSVINRCNTVIKYAPTVAAIDPGYTESELQATIAEVSALRDLCYFYLIRTFRDVPYSTVAYTDDDQEMDLEPTPFNAVLDSLITDLESIQSHAMGRYPEDKPAYQTGRITKCAIWSMLCEMYLWKGDYDKCVAYADLVIEDKKALLQERRSKSSSSMGSSTTNDPRLSGFPLISDQTVNTTYGNAYTEIFINGNSQETIFELVFDNVEAGRSMLGNSAVGLFYGNSTVTKGYIAPSSMIIEDLAKTSQRSVYADRNKRMDARLYENCNNKNEAINKFVLQSAMSIDASSTTPSVPSRLLDGGRYSYAKINDVDHYYNSSNWIIYRLSDIMLMKAEALSQKLREGSEAEIIQANQPILLQCFTLVNAVNKRSVCENPLVDTLLFNDYRTKAQMDELILKERQRELMFEGKRWYDLVRRSMRDGNTEVLCQAVAKREGINANYVLNFFSSQTTGMNAIFWPYNDEETKVNLNLAKHQNPAFSSGEGNISK